MSGAGLWTRDRIGRQVDRPSLRRLERTLQAAAPAILFGLRLWASICLALFIAFALELDNAYWAGTSAAVVCQPSLGASLRKASYRMVGTIVGALAGVILSGLFPQSRVGFIMSLALWCAGCGFVAMIWRNFASYAAALAGFTAAIIAADQLGATGGLNGEAFTFAVTRASEICIGIVSAGIVLAMTDFGDARRRLAAQLTGIATEVAEGLMGAFLIAASDQARTRSVRRILIRRISGLDAVIDEAIGEASDLRYRTRVLQDAADGLFSAVIHWRVIANHLERLPPAQGRDEGEAVLQHIPRELRSAPQLKDAMLANPSRLRQLCLAAARTLVALPAEAPSLRLLADQTAGALLSLAHVFNGLALLVDPARSWDATAPARVRVPDFLPPLISAIRVFLTVWAVALFWIATAWPNGAFALVFAVIIVVLFPARGDQANPAAMSFMLGACLAAILAALVKFTILPTVVTFPGFSVAIGLVLVPAGALQYSRGPMFTAVAANFIPTLAPSNPMNYDLAQFINLAVAIVVGTGMGVLALYLLPQMSPAARTRRLLALTLSDLRRLATGPILLTQEWTSRIYGRLSALPEQAELLQSAQIAAALSVGIEMIWLRRTIPRLDQSPGLDAALNAVARGDSAAAIERLAELDRSLAAASDAGRQTALAMRVRARICALSETIAGFAPYFDSKASQ